MSLAILKKYAKVNGFFCLFVYFCCFMSQDNRYSLGGFLGKLEQANNQYFVHILSLINENNPS